MAIEKVKKATAPYSKRSKAPVLGVREASATYTAEPPTFESVWRMFQESEKRMNRLEELFVTQWGKLVESLVEGDLVPLLRSRGIAVEQTSRRHCGCHNGKNFEFDIIAYDGDTIVIVEVKTTLRPQDVKEFLNELTHVREWIPRFADNRVCGAVAYLQEVGEASAMAAKRGLFTIRATGSSASITNSPDFQPKAF